MQPDVGEGWLLTAEMVELYQNRCAERGMHAALRALPNYVVGKAVIKELRRRYRKATSWRWTTTLARPR